MENAAARGDESAEMQETSAIVPKPNAVGAGSTDDGIDV